MRGAEVCEPEPVRSLTAPVARKIAASGPSTENIDSSSVRSITCPPASRRSRARSAVTVANAP